MAEEKRYEDKIKRFLKKRGIWFVKYFANRNTKVGVPDILACVNGKFVAIEVKASNGKPSPLQIDNRDEIRQCGGVSVIVYPEQFEALKSLIDAILKGETVDFTRLDRTK